MLGAKHGSERMAAKEKIPADSTMADLTGPPAKREEYVRRVVGNFHGSKVDKDAAVVRIGVQGRGVSPQWPEALRRRDRQRHPCRSKRHRGGRGAYEAKPEKNEAAAALGRTRGAARAKSMSPEQRADIAGKAAESRWKKREASDC